ncbi:MAG: Phenylalanine--tRNA ligase beta subunit [candidate division WS6 bacterium 34_10]|uniref:Phenylalanine--tRNA ligase beta subunit n=1 Tax=candidate division WS6 bacterium 34_10 TaxID=1641389 RepID=A0A101HJ81_9BACT|nr:MAG: Phenylalanine--tRNA ligase beta subunit [candidate division WS6 bacterium 34_10]
MRLPLNSARKYTELPKVLEETIEIIENKIGEVENYKDLKKKYKGIVIAQIKEKKEHPNADKLAVYKVTTGEEELIQVVAGDKTLEVGDKVAYIIPGGIVPSTYETESFEIKSVELRGEMSNGMMCSEKELDIGSNHERVFKLPKDAPVAESFAKYYQLDDTVVEIENKALTNRGDLFGILGLSRELAGAQGIRFESPNWYKEPQINLEPEEVCLNIDVDNQAESLCPRYNAIVMTDIEFNESPIWLKSTLLKCGIKPINVIVDITNYLMYLTGQPLHAFDYDKVISTDTEQADMAHVVIRIADPEESIHGIDGKVYELTDRNLVIANSQNPIALAGVIGGVDTEIDENTKSIIIESANFDRYNLRRTSMDLGIVTEASTRFTRSQSPELCLNILSKGVELISELAGGKIASTVIDSYPAPQKPTKVSLNIAKLKERLGIDISKEEITEVLESIEYQIIETSEKYITVQIPVFRQDIEIEEDVYEDIIRIYGYDEIPPKLPLKEIHTNKKPDILSLKLKIREILSNSGCNELISYSFTNVDSLKAVNQDPNSCFKIKNPLSKDLELMRPSILSNLLEKAKLNTQQGIETYAIYEIGISHQKDSLNQNNLPLEEWKLSFLFTDSNRLIDGNPYYQAKRYLEKVLNTLKVRDIEYTLLPDDNFEALPQWIKTISGSFEPNSTAIISAQVGDSKVVLGILGEINLQVKHNLGLNSFTSGFEINLEQLNLVKNRRLRHKSDSHFPYITQDICFVVPDRVTYGELYKKILDIVADKNIRSEIECIDIYKEEDSKNRNITLRISLSNINKTLKDNDFQKIREKIEKKFSNLNITIKA